MSHVIAITPILSDPSTKNINSVQRIMHDKYQTVSMTENIRINIMSQTEPKPIILNDSTISK